jgi:hypothetical protein
MKKRPPMPKFLDAKEIKNELKALKIYWDKIKDAREDKKSIENQFKEIIYYLKQSEMQRGLETVFIMYASSSLHLLKWNIQSEAFDYDRIFLSAATSEKISVFIDHKDKFTDEDYWVNLAEAYVLQNYKKIPYKVYYDLFSATKSNREKLMNGEEIKLFNKLPDEITIYRGGSKTEEKTKKYGISWTLNQKIAEQFAEVKSIRDKKIMVVHELRIKKSDAIAYFISREEEEMIYIHNR